MLIIDIEGKALDMLPPEAAVVGKVVGDSDAAGNGQDTDTDGSVFLPTGPDHVRNALVWNTWNTTQAIATLVTNNAGTGFESIDKINHARKGGGVTWCRNGGLGLHENRAEMPRQGASARELLQARSV